MAAAAMIALATASVTSDASVTFSSIPATYRDLILVYGGVTSVVGNLGIRLNGDSGNNYHHVRMYAVSGGAGSDNYVGTLAESGNTLTTPTVVTINIMDYSASDRQTTILARSSAGGNSVFAHANRWTNTSAVTSIQVLSYGGAAFTGTISLYGIKGVI
jgi:hypothetical protein